MPNNLIVYESNSESDVDVRVAARALKAMELRSPQLEQYALLIG